MDNRSVVIALLSLALMACGRPEPTVSTESTAVLATVQPAIRQPTVTISPASMPVPTYAVSLSDISTPATPVTTNQPLVVSPIITQTIDVQVGGQTLLVELASTSEQRQRGLMFRTQMAANAGMLFVFPTDQNLSFWMRNTQLPLSIAFIGADQRILNIDDMQPLDDQTFHASQGPARYALEVNQGWFARYGVKAGDRVEFTLPPNLEIR